MMSKCWFEMKSDLIENPKEKRSRCKAEYADLDLGFSIFWKELADDSVTTVNGQLEWDTKKRRLTVFRISDQKTRLVFVEKKETPFVVETDFGNFEGTIQTRQIDVKEDEKKLSYCLYIDYDLIFQDQPPQRNKMELFFGFLDEKCFFQERSRILA